MSGPCTVVDANAGTFSPTGTGSCVVQADSAATTNYLASSAQQTISIIAAPSLSNTILIYGPSLDSTAAINEKTIAEGAGYTVVVKNATEWSAMTTAGFSLYKAIVFADPFCAETAGPLGTAEANRTVWSPAVTGPKVLIGTDPVFHVNYGTAAAATLTLNAINFAASGSGTGMYMSLSCYYFSVATPNAVTALSEFGTFMVQGQGPSSDTVNVIAPAHAVMSGLTNTNMSNWGNSVHEWFTSYPTGWEPLAEETSGVPANRPYIIVKPAEGGE